MTSKHPGEGEQFSERVDLDELNVIREGTHNGYNYVLIERLHRTRRGGVEKSHYTGYVQIPEGKACCDSMINERELPHSPGHYGMNFGPTLDNWIGFGTLDERDFNFTADMKAFKLDRRMDENHPWFEEANVNYYTPGTLVDEILAWIEDIDSHLEEYRCRLCDEK